MTGAYRRSQQHGPLAAGMISLPMSAISVVLGPYAGRLSDKVGGKPIVVTGLLLFGLGLLLFTLTSTVDSTVWTLLPAMAVVIRTVEALR